MLFDSADLTRPVVSEVAGAGTCRFFYDVADAVIHEVTGGAAQAAISVPYAADAVTIHAIVADVAERHVVRADCVAQTENIAHRVIAKCPDKVWAVGLPSDR